MKLHADRIRVVGLPQVVAHASRSQSCGKARCGAGPFDPRRSLIGKLPWPLHGNASQGRRGVPKRITNGSAKVTRVPEANCGPTGFDAASGSAIRMVPPAHAGWRYSRRASLPHWAGRSEHDRLIEFGCTDRQQPPRRASIVRQEHCPQSLGKVLLLLKQAAGKVG